MTERQPLADKKKGRTGTSSVVWKHFGFELSDVEQKKIVCKLCRTIVSAPQGNTTNLFNHLKINHKVVYDEVIKEQKTQKSASTSASATT